MSTGTNDTEQRIQPKNNHTQCLNDEMPEKDQYKNIDYFSALEFEAQHTTSEGSTEDFKSALNKAKRVFEAAEQEKEQKKKKKKKKKKSNPSNSSVKQANKAKQAKYDKALDEEHITKYKAALEKKKILEEYRADLVARCGAKFGKYTL